MKFEIFQLFFLLQDQFGELIHGDSQLVQQIIQLILFDMGDTSLQITDGRRGDIFVGEILQA